MIVNQKTGNIFYDENLIRLKLNNGKWRIKWGESIGKEISFLYRGNVYNFTIIGYNKKGSRVFLEKDGIKLGDVFSGNLADCEIGRLLGIISSDFKYDIGYKINNAIITNRFKEIDSSGKYWKRYDCKCCIDGYEWSSREYNLQYGNGCPVCNNKIIVQGINDLYTTDKWMVDLGVDELFAKTHSRCTDEKAPCVCPKCKEEFTKATTYIYNYKSIACKCGDGFSYPEKVLDLIMKQSNLDYIYQLTKNNLEWCDRFKYDFYMNVNGGSIIEVHGSYHYRNSKWCDVEKVKNNDEAKKELAFKNGIKECNYIVIDCRKSDIKWIKNSILNSNLARIINVNNINWEDIDKECRNSLRIEACKMKRDNPNMTTRQCADYLNLTIVTIQSYWKWGDLNNLCDYKGREEYKKRISHKVKMYLGDELLGVYNSIIELSRVSTEIFGVKLYERGISRALKGEKIKYKGYTFKYLE